MPRKMNRKGRNTEEPFVRLPNFVLDSAAHSSLTALSQALLVHLVRRHNGRNNGAIALGHRDGARLCNVNKDTIKRAFDELEAKGLIRSSRKGAFNMKDPTLRRATEWRLTWLDTPEDRPTHDFKLWSDTVVG